MLDIYTVNVILAVLALWSIPWWIYNRFIRTKEYHPMGAIKFPTPHWMSCAIPYVSHNPKKNKCENVKFDGWSLGHVAIYFTLGLLLPGYWVEILVISIVCEAFEYVAGWRARWIIDPLANLAGYWLGHVYFVNLRKWKWLSSYNTTVVAGVTLVFLLFMNRPSMIPRGNEFY
jgi:uncharacterized membrane protein